MEDLWKNVFVLGLARAEIRAPDGNRLSESSAAVRKQAQAEHAMKEVFFDYCQLLVIGILGPFGEYPELRVQRSLQKRCRGNGQAWDNQSRRSPWLENSFGVDALEGRGRERVTQPRADHLSGRMGTASSSSWRPALRYH